jgi:hypothetical protein
MISHEWEHAILRIHFFRIELPGFSPKQAETHSAPIWLQFRYKLCGVPEIANLLPSVIENSTMKLTQPNLDREEHETVDERRETIRLTYLKCSATASWGCEPRSGAR